VARIGLVSDSFGNLDALGVAFDVFADAGAERVFFLGGWYADVDAVLARRRFGQPGAPVPRSDGEFLSAVEGALSRAAAVPEHPLAGKVTRVASRACPEAIAGAPRKLVDLVDGRICCLVHDKADLTRDDIGNATILFHGNSGRAALVQIGPRVFVTPGHLRTPDEEGRPASFAVAELLPAELVLTVFGPDGAEQRRERAPLGGGGGKVSVR
jgi:predicted phosphodiesterase